MFKIYKNKDKAGRWWFKLQGKLDGKTPPTEIGKSALISEINTAGLYIGLNLSGWKGNYYRFDFGKGELTCVLRSSDFLTLVQNAVTDGKINQGGPDKGVGQDEKGSFYLTYYSQFFFPKGRIFRLSADRSKLDEVVRSTKQGIYIDGPARETGWTCGPSAIYGAREDCIFMGAIDMCAFRRLKDGRVSTLMLDGEWRECNGYPSRDGVVGKGICMGPPESLPHVWIPYPGEERGGINGIFRFGPVDFVKPTVVAKEGVKK